VYTLSSVIIAAFSNIFFEAEAFATILTAHRTSCNTPHISTLV